MNICRRVAVGAMGLGLLAASGASAWDLDVKLSGMLAFVKEPSAMTLVVPNMFDRFGSSEHRIVHWPVLEVRCAELRVAKKVGESDKDRAGREDELHNDCATWMPSSMSGYGSIPLHGGVEISFELGSGAPGPLQWDASFTSAVRDLPALIPSSDAGRPSPELTAIRPAASLRDLALARWRIAEGNLSAELREKVTTEFKKPGSTSSHKGLRTPRHFRVRQAVRTEHAVLRISPYDGGSPLELRIAPAYGGNSATVWIYNDPHPLDYCRHISHGGQGELAHFVRFYDLTTVEKGEIPKLPRPYLETAVDYCHAAIEGKRVNCDAVMMYQ